MPRNRIKSFCTTSRRNFLKGVSIGTAGLFGSSVLSGALGSNRLAGLPGHLPHETDQLDAWLSDLRKHVSEKPAGGSQKIEDLLQRGYLWGIYFLAVSKKQKI